MPRRLAACSLSSRARREAPRAGLLGPPRPWGTCLASWLRPGARKMLLSNWSCTTRRPLYASAAATACPVISVPGHTIWMIRLSIARPRHTEHHSSRPPGCHRWLMDRMPFRAPDGPAGRRARIGRATIQRASCPTQLLRRAGQLASMCPERCLPRLSGPGASGQCMCPLRCRARQRSALKWCSTAAVHLTDRQLGRPPSLQAAEGHWSSEL